MIYLNIVFLDGMIFPIWYYFPIWYDFSCSGYFKFAQWVLLQANSAFI